MWRAELEVLEKSGDAKGAVLLLERNDISESELYLRVLFLLLDWMVEGQYSELERLFGYGKIQDIYSVAKLKFSDDSEFCFFCGIMIYWCEWCFGLDSVDAGTLMLDTAMRKEPDNILFKWGYISEINQRIDVNTRLKKELSRQILFKEPQAIKWLKSKGLLEEYVFGLLVGGYERLKNVN